jgi:hypothetical protein
MNPRRHRNFIAVLRRDGIIVEEIVLNRNVDVPVTLRFPTEFLGTAAWDVYRLSGLEQWPVRAHYDHEALTPRTTIQL